jgi:hypothetical protein
MKCGQGVVIREASPTLLPGGTRYIRGDISQAGENVITNAIKIMPSLLKVNHTDSDVGHSRHCVQICQSAKLLFV